MSTSKKLLSLLLCLTMIVSGFSFAFAGTAYDEADSYMKEVVETLGAHIDGEDSFDIACACDIGRRRRGAFRQQAECEDKAAADDVSAGAEAA